MTPKHVDTFSNLLQQLPTLEVWTESTPGYDEKRSMYLAQNTAKPLAIIRPQTEQEVSLVVKHAVQHSIPLTVRSGGHDWKGRSMIENAIVIDMRGFSSVSIVDESTATIGGGILTQDLVQKLDHTGHVTAVGASASVGYTGWATHGGYGVFASAFGLGCDQILGARVVDYEGNIFDADEDLLYGIRGAGGAFGVIVSLTIKIYKLRKMLAGSLMLAMNTEEEIGDFIQNYNTHYKVESSSELLVDAIFLNIPGVGKSMILSFVWPSEDLSLGRQHLERWKAVWPVAVDTVVETTPLAWFQSQQSNVPPWGSSGRTGYRAVILRDLGGDATDLLAKFSKSMPSKSHRVMWLEHRLQGAATAPKLRSSYGFRQAHVLLEILQFETNPDLADEAYDWVLAFDSKARQLPQAMSGGYAPLTPENVPIDKCFPGHWEDLQRLKSKHDPNNVFRHTISGLTGQ